MSNFSIIVAVDECNGIGYKNQLLHHISNDLKRFKSFTTGHTIVMGRQTYLSLPNGSLPNRRNIVLSRNLETVYEKCDIFHSIKDVKSATALDGEVFIIGGAQVYESFLPLASKLYWTLIHGKFKADTFFPDINWEEWTLEYKEEHYDHTFYIYNRNIK